MQELQNPWDHWFYEERANNLATMKTFNAAHGTETYAGIPSDLIHPSRPQALTNLLADNGFGTQPNQFDSTKIEGEIKQTGASPTWQAMYGKAVAGLEIPPPYFAIPQTDPAKVAPMVAAYQMVVAGTLPRDQLPDIRDTLLDAALPDMSIRPKAGLDGAGILQHMCRMCHNPSLDQTVSRANFDVDRLATMAPGEKQLAIQRLMKADTDVHKMPPVRFHVLSDAERQLVVDELSK